MLVKYGNVHFCSWISGDSISSKTLHRFYHQSFTIKTLAYHIWMSTKVHA